MGLLDEAIKQHLELKRRRGADPTEVERLEREALGPVRRLQQEPSEAGEEPIAREPDASYDEPEAVLEEDEDFEEEEYPEEYEPGAPARAQTIAPAQPDSGLDDDFEETEDDELPPPHPGGSWEEPRSGVPREDLGVETAEYDVEAEHAREEAREDSEGEDVLEETPEFFQDAPDHDRLWFEQRPPKDFDFDG